MPSSTQNTTTSNNKQIKPHKTTGNANQSKTQTEKNNTKPNHVSRETFQKSKPSKQQRKPDNKTLGVKEFHFLEFSGSFFEFSPKQRKTAFQIARMRFLPSVTIYSNRLIWPFVLLFHSSDETFGVSSVIIPTSEIFTFSGFSSSVSSSW